MTAARGMPGLTRVYFLMGAILILSIFYFSTSIHTARITLSAEERLAAWSTDVDDSTPASVRFHEPKKDSSSESAAEDTKIDPFPEVADSRLRESLGRQTPDQRHLALEKVLLLEKQAYAIKAKSPLPDTVDPFAPAFRKEADLRPVRTKEAQEGDDASPFNEDVYAFQEDIKFSPPFIDRTKFGRFGPHNYQGPGRPAFATYLSTRDSSLHDPYFVAAQQLTYRLLWHPETASAKYPLIVFVAPFIPEEHRAILTAAGAIVRELDLVPWIPNVKAFGRWRDLFSKLHIWGQTDFSKIAFLDLDTFPMQNIDGIFDVAPEQKCNPDLLSEGDRQFLPSLCSYIFSGVQVKPEDQINVGVVVLKPDEGMHQRLLRSSWDTEKFDNSMAEQAYLNLMFAKDGPFPMSYIDREWNGFYPQIDEEAKLKIVHEKLWAFGDLVPWTTSLFQESWDAMIKFYERPMFKDLRAFDGFA